MKREPEVNFIKEYLLGDVLQHHAASTSVKTRKEFAVMRMGNLGLDCVMLSPTSMKGVCKICGDTGTEYTDACDGAKHDAYYSKFPRAN